MLTSVTIKCDWAGCGATLTYEPRLPFPDKRFGWKHEGDGHYSHHLCPKHKRHSWHEVLAQKTQTAAPSTGRFMGD
jgi:hypothetical protein